VKIPEAAAPRMNTAPADCVVFNENKNESRKGIDNIQYHRRER